MKIRPLFAWYDLWIGAFWDSAKRRLYILPLPCIGVVLDFGVKPTPEQIAYDTLVRMGMVKSALTPAETVRLFNGDWNRMKKKLDDTWECPVCGGSGIQTGAHHCPTCHGTGSIPKSHDPRPPRIPTAPGDADFG